MLAPLMTMSGARSPPMPSSAMVIRPLTARSRPPAGSGGLGRARHYLAAVIVAASRTNMVRALHLAAFRAFGKARLRQRMVRSAHAAARCGYSFFRDCHWGLLWWGVG